jgi:aminoglycoside phosphotransferase (APT) family kinase protein
MSLKIDEIQVYLESKFRAPVEMAEIRQLTGTATGSDALKQFGYGRPLMVSCRTGGVQRKLVFHHIRANAFGREREDDRVAAVWLDFRTFDRLPRHVSVADMIIRTAEGKIRSIGDAREMLLVTDFCEGLPYAQDLLRLRKTRVIERLDLRRAERLGSYLATIHRVTHEDPVLWRRRLRDLVGHGEGIMGLADSYPPDSAVADAEFLRSIEEMANGWRWRLKPLSRRLSQVHGDFHPYNIVFEEADRFWVLDRSRGEWGEPADDVSCLSINYLFFSLQVFGRLEGPFAALHEAFWKAYLAGRADPEMREVIQPWFAWRALVLASPVWYPRIDPGVRSKLLTFARTVMSVSAYDYSDVNRYLGGA